MAKRAAKTSAKSKTIRRKAASKTARKTGKQSNVEILVAKGALDPGAAARLDPAVARRINKYRKQDVTFLIKHQMKVCGVARPAPDGSFF